MDLRPLALVDTSGPTPICRMCQRYCTIPPDQSGFCHTVINQNGVLYSTIYGLIAEHGIDPIEKKPVRCYRPGTRVLSLGTFGCNLRCNWCQNWEIAFVDARKPVAAQRYAPADVIATALRAGCAGIAWTYNEPSIWVDYIADCAIAARAAGLYTALVTNGLFSAESIAVLQPLIDVYRVDFKSLDDRMYRDHCHLPAHQSILDNIVTMHRAGVHIELVTVVMPDYIADEHIARMAEWIRQQLGPATPWHLTRFTPYARLTSLPPTTPAALADAGAIAHAAGLRRVYIGDWYEAVLYAPERVV